MNRAAPAPRLVFIAPAPVIQTGDRVQLDVKFVEGMRLHRAHWPGPVDCILRAGASQIPFATELDRDALGFGLTVLEPDGAITAEMLADYDLVMVSADDAGNLHLPALARQAGAKTCLSIEYTLETRLRIAWLERKKSLPRRLNGLLWNIRQERRRRRAFRNADAMQANGYPAYDAYRDLTKSRLLYLDNRMDAALFARDEEMAARAARLRGGGPLRLVYSGRLERMKGAQDLVPFARALQARGVRFTLEIFGGGSLEPAMHHEIAAAGLDNAVRLRGSVDFARELVPFKRTGADLFIAPHRQGDPSCTYLEAMGCGLAVAGYGNEMWRRLQSESGAGWAVPLGKIAALADAVATADRDRESLIARNAAARNFARQHDFASEFSRRMAHLRALVTAEETGAPKT